MVNYGSSKGCLTCRQRRVKCDEGKPECATCTSRGLACGGYGKKALNIRFKHQNIGEQRADSGIVGQSSQSTTPMNILPSTNEEDLALGFFTKYYAIAGRSTKTGKGYFETIVPITSIALSTSSVRYALSAISNLLFGEWHGNLRVLEQSRTRLGQTLRQLQVDLTNPDTRSRDATLLAIEMLQCHQHVRAVNELTKATRVHQDGAIRLIKSLGLGEFQSIHGKRLLLYVLSNEVGDALRSCRPVDPELNAWYEYAVDLPWNPSSLLDRTGVKLAETQYHFLQLTQLLDNGVFDFEDPNGVIRGVQSSLQSTLEALAHWPQTLPESWQPLRVVSDFQTDPPLFMYNNTCEVYPSIQVASAWNTWRGYNLLLLGVENYFLDRLGVLPSGVAISDLGTTEPGAAIHSKVQELMDSICYSIPFFLGNKSSQHMPGNPAGGNFISPNYHTLHHFGQLYQNIRLPDDMMSAEMHDDHILAQGAWQGLVVLSELLTTFARPANVKLLSRLRGGQMQWLSGQLFRMAEQLQIDPSALQQTIGGIMSANDIDPDQVNQLALAVRDGSCPLSRSVDPEEA